MWWEIDTTFWAIRLMAWAGLARGVKRPGMISAARSDAHLPKSESDFVGASR